MHSISLISNNLLRQDLDAVTVRTLGQLDLSSVHAAGGALLVVGQIASMESDGLAILGNVHVARPVYVLARVRLGQSLSVLELAVRCGAPHVLNVVLVGAVAVRAEEEDLQECEVSNC